MMLAALDMPIYLEEGGKMVTQDSESMLTVNQVARRLSLNPYTVRELLRNGDLIGFKIRDVRWRIKVTDLEAFIQKYHKDEYAL
jgi:excisionase family DNA binding protein